MICYLWLLSFPEWQPHFSLLDTPNANEMMALRWLHLVFGIIWIGLLYFFNLVLTPAMKKCDPKLRIRIYPELMPGAMGWFRSSALVTVIVGLRYFSIHLAADARGHMVLAREEAESGLRPAVSYLFRSLADSYGASAVGVLLTGMGKDGAAELKRMKAHGAYTIAQDRDSSIVHGMPGEAIELGAATHVLAADKIAGALIAQIGRRLSPEREFDP